MWKSAGRVPSLRVLPWHLPCNLGKSTEKTSEYSIHITKTPTHYKTHTNTHKPTHYKTHTLQNPHKHTHYKTHTNTHVTKPTQTHRQCPMVRVYCRQENTTIW
jgi:hypothetical protein